MADAVSFSDLIEHTGGNVQWSPNGKLLAAAKANKLTVRSEQTLEIVQLFGCSDKVAVCVPQLQYFQLYSDKQILFTEC